MPITGTGTAQILNFGGGNSVEGHLVATSGCPVNEELMLLAGATLTTHILHIGTNGPNQPTTHAAKVTVHNSSVVITGCNPPDTFAIGIANRDVAGTQGTLAVQGAHARVNGGNLPMCVGHSGAGVLTITQGAVVTVGNGDPIKYPWALVIGNHLTSNGTVEVSHGSLLVNGQVIVGRNAVGKLDVNQGGLVVAESMAIGWAPDSGQHDQGKGSVTVKGTDARLIVNGSLEVGHMGAGSLTVAEHGFVSAAMSIYVIGSISLDHGQIETTALGIDPHAVLSGNGTVIVSAGLNVSENGAINAHQQLNLVGDIDNAGTITVAVGGDLRCIGTLLDEKGSIKLHANSVASLEAVQSDQQTITFAGQNARLVLRSPAAFGGTIDGFGLTHAIELEAEADNRTYAGNTLTVTGPSGVVAQLQMSGNYTEPNFALASGFPSVITFSP
jgi:T5SS/PEP-CTERM-associated repeat protein